MKIEIKGRKQDGELRGRKNKNKSKKDNECGKNENRKILVE